jgi:transposase-like protein
MNKEKNMADLLNPVFTDEKAARAHLEALRWPKHRVCPHCGESENTSPTASKNHKPGLYYCNSCEKTFTVTVGTLFERSHVPLHKWMLSFHLMASSKKGISAHQLHRMLGVTYKTAWFMAHRIREAMRPADALPFGEDGGAVEIDETFIGIQKPKTEGAHGYEHKNKVLSLVDRTTGKARSVVLDRISFTDILPILRENASREARILTDEGKHYNYVRFHFAGHETVKHSAGEYVRMADRSIHTNTIEGFFSIFKRGMKDVYQHCGKQHLHRYLAEFDFRYSNRMALGINDSERASIALKGVGGKRLTYRGPRSLQ